jgi:hypothetical protein
MVTAQDSQIINFYNFVSGKPRNSDGHFIGSTQNQCGLLYVIAGDNPAIQVWLPADLLEYANASAGTSGSRAVGIRVGGFRSVEAAADEIVRIFSSPDNLARFINTSECDYTGPVNRKSKSMVITLPADPKASQGFWNKYNKEDMQALIAKHGRDRVQQAYNTLTMSEFESRFGLSTTELETA